MKTITLYFFLLLNALLNAQYQSNQHLSYRYWELRQRLLDRYLVVGDCYGCSLPVSRHHVGWNELVFAREAPLTQFLNTR